MSLRVKFLRWPKGWNSFDNGKSEVTFDERKGEITFDDGESNSFDDTKGEIPLMK